MGTGNFTFDITDYEGTTALLKKMRERMEDTVKLYRAAKGIPAKFAPQWSGDARTHLEKLMEEYAVKARSLQSAAEKLSNEALAFIHKRKQGDDAFMRKFTGISGYSRILVGAWRREALKGLGFT